MEKRGSLDKERYLFIYTRKKLEFHSKMSLVYCLMGLEGGCKSTPNTLYTSNDVRAVDAGVGNRLISTTGSCIRYSDLFGNFAVLPEVVVRITFHGCVPNVFMASALFFGGPCQDGDHGGRIEL
ncbi:hypothetical protein DY000_02020017 [Brassica cretica]|uniref:Xylanase inhibitor N-terminal domain-containing protein n=1 Tax=Brassica cretica TaxID=69181 RepID=A0ABQ7ECW4_BRACR|nr:hypothetical protein DY000_02020017 [Brassica cretica]